jgi:lysophospholipase L1-like esterase
MNPDGRPSLTHPPRGITCQHCEHLRALIDARDPIFCAREDDMQTAMTMLRRLRLRSIVALFLAFAALAARADGDESRWVGTWSAAMQAPLFAPAPVFSGVTLRQIVHLTIGGAQLRVRFSNAQGSVPLAIDAASVGVRASGATVRAGSLRALHFAGAASIQVPPGAVAISDPVALDVEPQSDLAISLFVSMPQSGSTQLTLSHQTSYVSTSGDFTDSDSMTVASTNTSWYWLSGVEVKAGEGARAIVAFGDSITEGFNSTTDANARWPDVLARRLLANRPTRHVAILNEAISGNRVLNDEIGPNAQRRIDRDVLTQGGLAYVILLECTNDLGFSQLPPGIFPFSLANVSAAEIIAGYEQIIRRAHQAGAKIFGATVLPFAGASYYNAAVEPKRAAINQFIRTSGRFDGVIDFDAVMRDPAHPTHMRPEFDSGDHLHPNDAGYAAMGNSIDLALFQTEHGDD